MDFADHPGRAERTAVEWASPMPDEQIALVDLYAGHGCARFSPA